jgi:hypothetical protein
MPLKREFSAFICHVTTHHVVMLLTELSGISRNIVTYTTNGILHTEMHLKATGIARDE